MTLAASGVTAGTYTKVTVDSKGRVTVGASATTSDISEGTNLYYTDARVLSYLGANNYATQSYVTTQINNLVAGAPGLLDTLDELAAALGDDANFATTTATSLGNRLRIDIGTQGLTSTQQGYGRTNLGLGSLATLSSIGNSYITDLAWSKLSSTPTTISGYGITNAYTDAQIQNFFNGANAISGYNKTNWDTAYGWGNHASAGYLTTSSAASTYQPLDADLTAIAALGTTGFLKRTGANTWSLDTNTYLTSYTETDPYRVTAVAVSGTSTKTITLTRADASTVTTTWTDIDTDTNTYVTSAGFSGGTLTLTRNDAGTVTVSLDGRYYLASNPSSYITSSSLTSYVPYTGATANIDTGGYSITAGAVTLTSNLWLKNIGTYDFIMSNGTSVTTNTIRAYYNTSDELRFYAKNTAGSAVVPKIMVGDGTTFYTLYHSANIPTWNQNTTGTAAGISSSAPTLAVASESNSIYVTAPSYTTGQITKPLIFDWYGNYWTIGNVRSGSTPSNGFGIGFQSITPTHIFTTTGLTINGNTALHSGNYTSYAVTTGGYSFGTAFTLGTMYVGTGAQATVTSLLGVYSNGYTYTFGSSAVQSWLGLGTMAYASTSSYVPYGSLGNTFGMNDQKLYLRTNGDNNHYIWNAADDWEEIVAYNGTGLRISTSTGTTLATFAAGASTFSTTVYHTSNVIGGNFGTNTYKRNLFLTIDQAADTTWFRIYVPQDYASDYNGGTIKVRIVWCGIHATFGQYQDFQISYKTYYPGSGYTKFSNVFNTNKTTDFAGATYYPASNTPNVQFYDNNDGYLYAKITGYHSGYNRLRLIEAEILGRTTATPVLETCSAPGAPSEIAKGISFEPHSGTITTSGDIIAYGSPSDNRLKTIKEKVPHALDSINKISGYRFDWKNPDEVLNLKEDIGVIAQEVLEVLPELVRTNEDGFMSVRHQGLTAVLVEAIKELSVENSELKARLERIESKLKD